MRLDDRPHSGQDRQAAAARAETTITPSSSAVGDMKGVDTIARIRREFFVQGKSIKEIVREQHVSRNTVRIPNHSA